MRPLSLFRPSAWPCAAGPVAADSGLAGAGRGYTPSGEFGSGSLPGRPRQDGPPWEPMPGSGGGERVVAELGQDVTGLAEDLAGLGDGCPLAVLAVFDLRVVGVVRRRGAGVGLAGLIDRPAQYLRALPGQPPGRALAVGGPDGDVQPGEPDRLAGGGEPVGAAQPAGHRQRGGRADP